MFDKLDKPFVLFGENHRGYDFVDSDNQMAEKMATQYALDRLYKHIILSGSILRNHSNIRVKLVISTRCSSTSLFHRFTV